MGNKKNTPTQWFKEYAMEHFALISLLKTGKDKSEEAFFGEHNPLKDRLTGNFTLMREIRAEVLKENPKARPRDVLVEIKNRGVPELLKNIICEEFNIERCAIGWFNDVNACCYPAIYNAEITGKSEAAKKLRANLSDLVEMKNGFKYKDKKGIVYLICLGYPIFVDDSVFTVDEAVACILHELGHAMQQTLININAEAVKAIQKNIIRMGFTQDPFLSKTDDMNDKQLSNYGEEILDSMDPDDMGAVKYSKVDDSTLDDWNRGSFGTNWDKDVGDALKKKMEKANKVGWFRKLIGTIGTGLLSLLAATVSIIVVPLFWSMNSFINNKHVKKARYMEEYADNFAFIYGAGVASASLQKKLGLSFRSKPKVFNWIFDCPLLNIAISYQQMSEAYTVALLGYPTERQRIVNMYRAAEFELQNAKDLSEDNKKALKQQIEDLKEIYNDFVSESGKCARWYRRYAGIAKKTIEEEAKQDPNVYENVLIPLQKKKDPKFKAEE